jgi:hypothetical protein
MVYFPLTRKLINHMKRNGSSDTLASSYTASKPPSYSPRCEDDDGSFDSGSFKPPFDTVSSNGTETPIQFTPGTTVYGGSRAGSTLGKSKKPRHKAPHCPSCICPSSATDPNALKDYNGRPYGRRQLINASVSALRTFNCTGDATLQADQMRLMRQALMQSELPYTDALLQNSGMFEPLNEFQQNSQIRALINPEEGFPKTLQGAFEATCEPNSQNARKGLKGFHERLKMATLESDDDDDSD